MFFTTSFIIITTEQWSTFAKLIGLLKTTLALIYNDVRVN